MPHLLSRPESTRAVMTTVAASAPSHHPARGRGGALLTRVRRARVRWKARRLTRARAVILDVETTDLDGSICQIAVIDTDGQVLINTLVNPQRPCSPHATAVHGLADADLVDAPTWAQIWPAVHDAVKGRTVLAYNAPFDRGRVLADCARAGLSPAPLADPARWWCVMRARARADGAPFAALGGTHDALGDVQATLEVLHRLTARYAS